MSARLIYISLIAGMIALIAVLIHRNRRRPRSSLQPGCPVSGNCLQLGMIDDHKLLKRGTNGPEVCQLQKFINQVREDQSGSCIAVDGAFGPQTEAALYDLFGDRETTLFNTNFSS